MLDDWIMDALLDARDSRNLGTSGRASLLVEECCKMIPGGSWRRASARGKARGSRLRTRALKSVYDRVPGHGGWHHKYLNDQPK